jgi:hypothetical protein
MVDKTINSLPLFHTPIRCGVTWGFLDKFVGTLAKKVIFAHFEEVELFAFAWYSFSQR